jgi:hypothetical protein
MHERVRFSTFFMDVYSDKLLISRDFPQFAEYVKENRAAMEAKLSAAEERNAREDEEGAQASTRAMKKKMEKRAKEDEDDGEDDEDDDDEEGAEEEPEETEGKSLPKTKAEKKKRAPRSQPDATEEEKVVIKERREEYKQYHEQLQELFNVNNFPGKTMDAEHLPLLQACDEMGMISRVVLSLTHSRTVYSEQFDSLPPALKNFYTEKKTSCSIGRHYC